MGSNLSGSFAPSSIRSQESAVFSHVAGVDENGKYYLQNHHVRQAFEKLIFEDRMDAVYLSLFLHRDYAYTSVEEPTPQDIAVCFRQDFRYDSPKDDREFDALYVGGQQFESYNPTEWFTEIT